MRPVAEAPAPPIRTDQTSCYTTGGETVPCPSTGQDGDKRAGVPWPRPRFEPDGETVRDRLTGRAWLRDLERFPFPLSWAEARAAVAAENGAGEAPGWRLPTRRELFELVSHARKNPALPADHPFVNVFPGYYWTASECARLPDQAWYVHLGGARVFKGMKHGSYMVWPVRDGAAPRPTSPIASRRRFRADGETVEDRLTGLVWPADADLAGAPTDWAGALAAVGELNRSVRGGRRDWRLPNVREIESLIDLSAHSPALAPGHPFVNVRDGYWSSTTSVYDPAYAWVLYLIDGPVGVGYKPKPEFSVWPVAGGFPEGEGISGSRGKTT